MLTKSEIENKLLQLKPVLSSEYAIKKIGYFGSYSVQQHNHQSDLDILVEFSKPIGWKFFHLEKFLEEQFHVEIDLVTPNALREQLKEQILKQVRFV